MPAGAFNRLIQGKNLIEGLLEGDEAYFNQLLPGASKDLIPHIKTLTEGLIGVIAQTLGIGHGGQKQVKGRGLMTAAVYIALSYQAMIQPTKLFWNFTQSLGTYQMFFDHKGLLVG